MCLQTAMGQRVSELLKYFLYTWLKPVPLVLQQPSSDTHSAYLSSESHHELATYVTTWPFGLSEASCCHWSVFKWKISKLVDNYIALEQTGLKEWTRHGPSYCVKIYSWNSRKSLLVIGDMLSISKCFNSKTPCELYDLYWLHMQTQGQRCLSQEYKIEVKHAFWYLNLFILPRKERGQVTKKSYFSWWKCFFLVGPLIPRIYIE